MSFLIRLWQDLNVQEKEKEILEKDLQGEVLEIIEILKNILEIGPQVEIEEVLEEGEVAEGAEKEEAPAKEGDQEKKPEE